MIVTCEIAFWVVIGLGFIARYMLRMRRTGLFLLALTPVIDLILLITTSVDLHRGTSATLAHALAAVYIGVSLAFGKSMIRWADERFLYYVMKTGSAPRRRFGTEYAIHYFKGWLKHVLAYVIGAGCMIGLIYLIQDAERTEALSGALRTWTLVLGIDLIIAISNFIWPKKEKK